MSSRSAGSTSSALASSPSVASTEASSACISTSDAAKSESAPTKEELVLLADVVQLSPQVQAAIAQIVATKDATDDPQFNATRYVNELFPDEESLEHLDETMTKLAVKIRRLESEIALGVRKQSHTAVKGRVSLQRAKSSMLNLFEHIQEIKRKASHSETMVQDICAEIKKLDNAKDNLESTITALNKMHMLVHATKHLEEMTNKQQYREVANLLESINDISVYFKDYQHLEQILNIQEKVTDMKSLLRKDVYRIFREHSELSTAQRISHAPQLIDVCFVIDAMGEKTKTEFVKWFCDRQLRDYRMTYTERSEHSAIENVPRRFEWIQQELSAYDAEWLNVFPPPWLVKQAIVLEFARLTGEGILVELEKRVQDNSLDVTALLQALRRSVKFENEMEVLFQQASLVQVARPPFEEDIDALDDVDRDEMNVDEDVDSQQPTQPSSIKNTLSAMFNPYMSVYIQDVDTRMRAEIEKCLDDWEIDEKVHLLDSARKIVLCFRKAMEACLKLTRGQAFYDLSNLFKKFLLEYAQHLHARLPQPTNGLIFHCDADQQRIIATITNTCDYLKTTSSQMAEKIKKEIDPQFAEGITTDAVEDEFARVASASVSVLVAVFLGKLDPAIQKIPTMSWSTFQMVGDQSPYVNDIAKHLHDQVPFYQLALPKIHFLLFWKSFVVAFVSHLQNAILQCKRVSEEGQQQMHLDVVIIKKFLSEILKQGPSSAVTSTGLKRLNKFVDTQMDRILMIFQVLSDSSGKEFIDSYSSFIEKRSESGFVKMMTLKGLEKAEQTRQIEMYRQRNPDEAHSMPTGVVEVEEDTNMFSKFFAEVSELIETKTAQQ
eukprot:CAMPEP_0177640838 /NCGR_PEP_ID=MMETSP0447-20121125/6755_1 /TAXON_ID=0 /ORGANISM="Stygamoeba regulata, Strain BSH-02190019" /LENGTH=833 /DNA_ID=CAMNT_0019142933 /DNA_START=47 /DNA_END=2548 /DNA_ORIENTATION=-